ncbi:hypothetical protein QN277_009999 [Acacia crassicarpa]|uniref:DUF599 domain-containing protein n=1 Tax=Acacia crassicarpa TaxID=499986 RepID=A0AAE1IP70_9FABA|nr:hypothetical protein QN277_009999 [Acacia crassicarpa]
MEKKILDFILVPSGLLVLMSYHLWLLHRIIKNPTKTVIGVNAIDRRLWVREMMEDASKNGVRAVESLRTNIRASFSVVWTAIMLIWFNAVFINYNGAEESQMTMLCRNGSQQCFKFFAIGVCFMVAVLMHFQSTWYYCQASILINVPFKKECPNIEQQIVKSDYVAALVNRGSHFSSLGLRAFYFSFPTSMWLLGPIPMFVSCFVLVLWLYVMDVVLAEYGNQNRTRDVEAAAEISSSN